MIKRVEYNGDMHWTATNNLEVTCEADVSKYPFDTHKCFLLILPLGYHESEISVSHFEDLVLTEWYTPHNTWELVHTEVEKGDDPGFFGTTFTSQTSHKLHKLPGSVRNFRFVSTMIVSQPDNNKNDNNSTKNDVSAFIFLSGTQKTSHVLCS
jgi:hypothetical protein